MKPPEQNDENTRYSRQIAFEKIGGRGQKKIAAARAVIIGVGALGSVTANNLCRAGVGRLRLVDSDRVEFSNLPRQALFDEADAAARLPKVKAAYNHLARINSRALIEPLEVRADPSNIEALIAGADVVLDGSDNLETRYLVNEACHKLNIPWVYGGVLGASGNCLTVLPGRGPCFRCLIPDPPPPGSYPTCETAGVLNMVINIIASVQSAEALKIITGSPDTEINRRLFSLDLWNNTVEYLEVSRNAACPVCARGEYSLPGRPDGM